jgi:hypothetical protein
MDWMEIIRAHVMWKQRLTTLLAGESTEVLDPESIREDNRCALGIWIYGEGATMSQLSRYEDVRELHAQFHEYAANVVALYRAGRSDDARQLLSGDYSKLSEKLKHRILGLSQQVKTASDDTPRF